MSAAHRAASAATSLACRAVGRRNVVRTARFMLHQARLDIPNDMRSNGESALQRWVLEIPSAGAALHVLDVGANVGRWSAGMLAAARQAGRLADLDLHAFEPSALTFSQLSENLGRHPVTLHRIALNERSGSASLHVLGPGAGVNSLHPPVSAVLGASTEEVATSTADAWTGAAGLRHITVLKIDTEGHDLAVLRGARELLAGHHISVAQFEYNHRWIAARSFLRDAFLFLSPLGYRLGKLTPRGVEFYPSWDTDLETFVEGNYVACTPSAAATLPAIPWWKEIG